MVKKRSKKRKKTNNKLKKEFALLISQVLLLLIMAIVLGVFIFSNNLNSSEKINNVTASYLTFTYKEEETDHIQLKSTIPLSDTEAKEDTKNYFEFKVTNTSNTKNNYQIILQPNLTSPDKKHLKVYLTDKENKPILGFDKEVPVWTDFEKQGQSIIIYTGELNKKESKVFRLMVWISKDYIVTDEFQNFSFKVAIKDNNK